MGCTVNRGFTVLSKYFAIFHRKNYTWLLCESPKDYKTSIAGHYHCNYVCN